MKRKEDGSRDVKPRCRQAASIIQGKLSTIAPVIATWHIRSKPAAGIRNVAIRVVSTLLHHYDKPTFVYADNLEG